MLNKYLNKYSNYILANVKTTKPTKNKNKKIKINYYKLNICNFYLKKQLITKYSISLKKTTTLKKNVFFYKRLNNNNVIISNLIFSKKNQLIKREYFDIYNYLYNFLIKNDLNGFKNYWLLDFYNNYKKTNNNFFFVNRTKFFSSQRLVKQHILIFYNSFEKKKNYINYPKIFKYCVNKNDLFFYKIMYIYVNPCLDSKLFFFKYNNFLKQFINENKLLLLLV